MRKDNSKDFFVKVYLDEIDQLKTIQEESGEPTPVALQLLFAKVQLYLCGTADCPDNPLARVVWKSIERRTLDDRNHRERISEVRASARKSGSSTNESIDNNCNQMKSIDNNCNQMISNDINCNQMISNDTEEEVIDKEELVDKKDKAEEKDKIDTFRGQAPRADVQKRVGVDKPSSIEEVVQYAQYLSSQEKLSGRPNTLYGKNLTQYVDRFFDYWESAGWKRKSGYVKDWRASFRTWCRNEFGKANPTAYRGRNDDTKAIVLSTNVDCSDAYNDPDPFGKLLREKRAEREQTNQNEKI